jgi:hypothetical protein
MRTVLTAVAMLLLPGAAAWAQDFSSSGYCDPICLQLRDGTRDCSFHNYAQCEATRSGIGGICVQNPLVVYCTRKPPSQSRYRR